ncbi:MAG: YkvA family protein [Candidatus Hodarchaeales archaeon]|jgi:uncharacterized membrane protein YkvA (DUF1232 family)
MIKELKTKIIVIFLVSKSESISFWKKIFLALIIGYLLSPIDLIPDFIPIFGYLDDLIIIPIALGIAYRIIPQTLIKEKEYQAQEMELSDLPLGKKTAILITLTWVVGISLLLLWIINLIF